VERSISMPPGQSEQIAEEALAEAIRRRCRGASWQGLARELAWRAVTGGHRDARLVEPLADAAEAMMASLVDEALWTVEQRALESWDELVREQGRDSKTALAAARLDAGEEATRLVDAGYDRVLDTLLATSRRAA
jgi:hypothetical protein